MKIVIEAQRIFRPRKHGMDFVALEIIRNLRQLDRENEYYIVTAPGEDRCLSSGDNFQILEIQCPTYPLWEQIALPYVIHKIKPDLVHCTSNTAPLFCPYPLVLTLHDIIFMGKKNGTNTSWYQNLGWYYRRFITPRILSRCRKVITVSQTAETNIQKRFSLGSRLTTIYNGYSPQYRLLENVTSITQKYCQEKDYLFFLGNTDPRKNTLGVLRAYSLYRQHSTHPLPLILSGLSDSETDALLTREGLKPLKSFLRLTGYLPGKDLPALYNGASAFLFPSFSEGFGIPILEAMACGTPVITSNISSMPEIAGEGAILVDPQDTDAIANALLRLENDTDFRQAQIAYGLERVKKFSWQATARQVLQIYRTLNS